MNNKARARELTEQMTLEEKASLCSGLDTWRLKGIERLALPSVMMADGPHGLRKQPLGGDHLGLGASVKAVCFPTASALACSFDRDLLQKVSAAIGEEAQKEGVSVLLGPGVNIKRSPLCGRNFEYFSEDPYLTGELAASFINGVQSVGVGASLKHYAANDQETRRMTIDALIDERALREIYLHAFETAVKKAQPWTVMSSYNRLGGAYVSNSKRMLHDILRLEWGFDGLVVSDWGGTYDRLKGVEAGLDLEMPSSNGYNDAKIVEVVKNGALPMEALDAAAERVTRLILDAEALKKEDFTCDMEAHHALARKAAAQSCVLLENKNALLPLKQGATLAVIGRFAKEPRYQGAGSSLINPTRLDSAFDALMENGVAFEYADGYDLSAPDKTDEALLAEACRAASGKDAVLIFAGLPPSYESEGFDRINLHMPESHNKLIEAVCTVNPNVAVILQLGAPVLMPWREKTRAILLAYLGGQAGGSGLADVLLGFCTPSGKLAESFPLALEDTPCFSYFPGGQKTVEYRESIFVGYRYYDAAKKAVAYPFGHGLSYTSFAYSDLSLSMRRFKAGDALEARFTVTNTGLVRGAEVVQLYVRKENSAIFRAERALKGFEKVVLEPGESKTVSILLGERCFSYYNVPESCFALEGGVYFIEIGASSRDIRLQESLELDGDGKESALSPLYEMLPAYARLGGGTLSIPDAEFSMLLGRPLPPAKRQKKEPFTLNSTLSDASETLMGKLLLHVVRTKAQAALPEGVDASMRAMHDAMLEHMPLEALALMSGGALTVAQADGIVALVNGRFFEGIKKLLGK